METHDRLERQNTEQTAAGDTEDRTDMTAGKNKKIEILNTDALGNTNLQTN